jgi:hypothetical protein
MSCRRSGSSSTAKIRGGTGTGCSLCHGPATSDEAARRSRCRPELPATWARARPLPRPLASSRLVRRPSESRAGCWLARTPPEYTPGGRRAITGESRPRVGSLCLATALAGATVAVAPAGACIHARRHLTMRTPIFSASDWGPCSAPAGASEGRMPPELRAVVIVDRAHTDPTASTSEDLRALVQHAGYRVAPISRDARGWHAEPPGRSSWSSSSSVWPTREPSQVPGRSG